MTLFRRLAAGLLAAALLPCLAFSADTTLSPTTLTQVEVGASEDSWGDKLNANASVINGWFDAGPALKVANGGTGSTTAATARTALGLAIGTNVQAYDADLTTLGALGSGARTALGLGTSAVVNTGTSGTTIPLLDGANTWSAAQAISGVNIGTVPGTDFGAATTAGWRIVSTGIVQVATSGLHSLILNRLTNDGQVAVLARQGAGVGSISVTASAAAFNTTSDYRLKTNVTRADPAVSLALINKVLLHNFDWKVNGSHDRGVLAHELQAVKPTAVTGVKDGKDMQAVDYSKLVPDLIGAVQALKAANDNLAKRVAVLEARAVRVGVINAAPGSVDYGNVSDPRLKASGSR